MNEIKCGNCGAPIKPNKQMLSSGTLTCGFCGSAYKLNQEETLDEDVKAGLRLLNKVQSFFGFSLEELNQPKEKPYDTKIELDNSAPEYRPRVFLWQTDFCCYSR